MERILLIGDPHFKVSNCLETQQLFESVKKYLDNNKDIDFIVVLGDILDTHEKVHVQPLCRSICFIKMLASYCKTYILIGNHDRINNNVFMTEEHPFTSLKNYSENLIIVDKTYKENDFYFVPYVPNGRFLEALGDNFENSRAIFAHQEFRGCKMGAIISETGDIWDDKNPPVFSGHIHDFQRVQSNIIYTGTPFQHSFGDDENKGIFLLKMENNDFELEKIELDIIKKRLISMDIIDFEKYEIPKKCILKINFYGDPHLIKKLLDKKSIKEKIKKNNIRYKIASKNIKRIVNKEYSFQINLKRRLENSEKDVKILFDEIFF